MCTHVHASVFCFYRASCVLAVCLVCVAELDAQIKFVWTVYAGNACVPSRGVMDIGDGFTLPSKLRCMLCS